MHTENLTLYRGDTHAFSVQVFDDADKPLDLTGTAVAMVVAPKGDYPPFSPHIRVLGNVIVVTIEPNHTQGAAWRSAQYDIQLTQNEVVTTIVRGRIELIQDITP